MTALGILIIVGFLVLVAFFIIFVLATNYKEEGDLSWAEAWAKVWAGIKRLPKKILRGLVIVLYVLSLCAIVASIKIDISEGTILSSYTWIALGVGIFLQIALYFSEKHLKD
jgi:hypothetical protein